ncbi:MAG: hypothetical protein JWR01_2905 [Subtercola sp.]|nr:hypothetical protein [Subtercola sp.]
MPTDPAPIRTDYKPKRQQLPDEVASYVREIIMTGAVRPGEFLRLDRISAALGVSNTPVREGLLALSGEGFVIQVPRRGFVVAPFRREDIRDLFWAQAWLAGELAARAATRIGPAELDALERIVGQYETAQAENDGVALADLGHAFHREINLSAGSVRLATLLGSVVRNLPHRFYATIEGAVDASLTEHPLIIEALRAGDPEGSRKLMERHVSVGANLLIDSLERAGMWGDQPTS